MASTTDAWDSVPPKPPRDPDPLPWVGLGLAAMVMLSYPWFSPFTQGRVLFGIPLILWYLFGVYALLIVACALQRTEG
ncbi:hypothetical protein D3C86_312540 [compost metagenome]